MAKRDGLSPSMARIVLKQSSGRLRRLLRLLRENKALKTEAKRHRATIIRLTKRLRKKK